MKETGASNLLQGYLLPAILLLAFGLRLTGSGFGLPFLYHADEPIIVNHALAYGMGDFNPHFFRIPPLISYLLFGLYGGYYLTGLLMGRFSAVSDFEALFYSDPSSFYWIGRVAFGVIAGTLTVYALFRLVKNHFGDAKAIFASFMLAVCFLHVRDSHYLYVDIPLVLVMTFFFNHLFNLSKQNTSLRSHIILGAWIGLASAVKYNGCFLALPYIYYSLNCEPSKRKIIKCWLTAGLSSLAIFILLNPYAVLDFSYFMSELKGEAAAHQGTMNWMHHIRYSLEGAVGLPLLIMALLGIIRAVLKKNQKQIAMAVFIGGYYIVLVMWGQAYARYVLPLLPPVIYFAAEGIEAAAQRIFKSSSIFPGLLLTAAISIPTIVMSVKITALAAGQDTRTTALNWIESNLPPESRVALDIPFSMPRLSFSKKKLEEKISAIPAGGVFSKARSRRLDYLMQAEKNNPGYDLFFLGDPANLTGGMLTKPVIQYSVAALRKEKVRYVVISYINQNAAWSPFYDDLKREADKIAEFTPYRDQGIQWLPDLNAITALPFHYADLSVRNAAGPLIEVYELTG